MTWPSSEKYMDLFPTSCRNMVLGPKFTSQAKLKRLVDFSKINQMTPIRTLHLDGWQKRLTVDHGRIMAEILKEVESFTLSNSKVYGDMHDCILQYMPNLKSLKISQKKPSFWLDNHQWLTNAYPKLEYFAWHDNTFLSIQEFLRTNTSIRFFSFKADMQNAIKDMVSQNIRIDELFFTLNHPNDFSYLQQLCAQQGIKP